ncbi:alpha-2Db adrenergic receptor-like [Ruditapes philippinarum]|uniref:alpha-2Db adrenergic receptor-like n=1 Tax=Ruditapes philippinarum TaxID=129788 RepID=UPI00295AFA49|nr:alpha-2Db adrenergic receptor-like [Ruditapes philippinarum]
MDNTSSIAGLQGNLNDSKNGTFFYTPSPIGPDFFTAYNIYLYLMITLGVLGNLIVLAVFLCNRPSNTTDWFILAITICDFISSAVNIPVYATFTNGYWRVYGTTLICRLHMFLSQSIVLSSAFLICGLALDRYLKICRRLSSFTTTRARNACFLITASTTLLSIPSYVMYENRAGRCVSIVMNSTLFSYYFFVFMIFVFATIVVVFSYWKVTKAVVFSESNIARHTMNRNTENGYSTFCCCFSSNNRVVPAQSTSNMSRSGLFKDTVVNTTCEQSSSIAHTENDKDHLNVTRPKDTTAANLQGQVTTVSGQFADKTYNKNQHISAKTDKQSQLHNSASLRTTKISFLVCSVFILSWIPPWLSFVLASFPSMTSNLNVVKFMMFGRMTYLINGFSNPIIYTLLNKKFRRRIVKIFCRHNL